MLLESRVGKHLMLVVEDAPKKQSGLQMVCVDLIVSCCKFVSP